MGRPFTVSLDDQQIAAKTSNLVQRILAKKKERKKMTLISAEIEKSVCEDLKIGDLTWNEISIKHGIGKSSICRINQKYKINYRKNYKNYLKSIESLVCQDLKTKIDYSEIASSYNITYGDVIKIAKNQGLQKFKRISDEIKQQTISLIKEGKLTDEAIYTQLGISEPSLNRIKRAAGVKSKKQYVKITEDVKPLLLEDLNKKELLDKDIAKKYNVTCGTIAIFRKENNITKKPLITKDQENKILEYLIEDKISLLEISKIVNISHSTVCNIRKKYGFPEITRRHGFLPINHNYFEKIDTPDKAYWLGWIITDGCIHSKSELKNQALSFELSAIDVAILEELKKHLGSEHKITVYDQLEPRNEKIYKKCKYTISCKKICDDLEKLGVCSNKSNDCKLPILSDDLMPHLIRGLIDGDGWVLANKKPLKKYSTAKIKHDFVFGFCSSVKSFVEEFRNFLIKTLDLNEVKIYNYSNSEKCFKVIYVGNQQGKKFYDYIYSCGGPRLERKYKRATEHFKHIGMITTL